MKLLAVDVGGTYTKYARYDSEGEKLRELPKQLTPQSTTSDLISQIVGVQNTHQDIEGIAISMPGTLDNRTGYIYQGGALQYNSGKNIAELLTQAAHCQVAVENDARCAAMAEMWKGNLIGINNALVLVLGTGLGGAIVQNGEIYRGTHLYAGELSILMTKSITEYGLQAVLGAQVGIPAFVNEVGEKLGRKITGPQLFELVKERNAIATEAFQQYIDNFVPQLFNFQIMYDPQKILIGGGVSNNPVFVNQLRQSLEEFYDRLPIHIAHDPLGVCKFGSEANLLGAVKNYLDRERASE
ncbi:MAG: ROK family protein [Schleiferilactobacillus harbinensis]|jgi:predicted NBD/HSP70 family sugar kinase|nr:ROK family protein [Schleiferilactobacillus harbinensis]MCI1911421.1 ROK family protein [Schleiferilactobacillus harbinensis]